MKNVVGFVIGIGLFALKAVINPFGTAADLISNVADVWTEFAGDGAQKGIEKIAEKIKEKRDFNKIAEKFRSELSAIYEGAEGESLAEKIFRELADAENAEKGKRIGFKKKPKKGAVMSDLIIKEIFGADLEEYLKDNSATFRNLLSDKQKEAFAAVMREAQKAYLEINFKGLDKELQIVAEVTANAVAERGEKNANKAVGELKEFFISLFSKNGGDTTVGELVKGAVVRKLQYVEKSCPNCGAYGDRVIHKKDKQGNVYEISCGVCGNSYFVLRDVADDNAALENFIKEHGDREEEARRELYSLYLRKFEETDKILFDVKDAVDGLLNITEQGFETMNTKLDELKNRPANQYDEIMKLGKSYLDLCEFALAYNWYRDAAKLCPGRAEAFFGMALAKCEVQLVYDYNNCREQPICYKKDIDFSSNAEYKTALKNSAAEQKAYFEKIADRIDKIVYWLTKYEEEGRKYDCFICTKVSVKRGSDEKTVDCKWIESNRLCAKLKEDNGISTFYSEIDCKDKVGEQYEALVLYALNKAKCMIVVCSDEAYLETPWVKNEYRRFCGILNRRGIDLGAIIIVYNGTPVKLPGLDREGFQDVNRRDDNAFNNLIASVKKRVNFNWDRKYCLKCERDFPKNFNNCPNCDSSRLVDAKVFYKSRTDKEKAILKAEIEKVKAEKEAELEKERKAREEAEKKALEAEKLRKQYEEQEKRIKALEAELLKKQPAEVAVAGPLNLDNDGLVDFEIEDGVLINYSGKAEHVVIPAGVTSIGAWAFKECSSLKSIEIPKSVTSIGYATFLGCSSLKSIEIPKSITSIGACAFKDCSSLEKIIIPKSVIDMGENAFDGCPDNLVIYCEAESQPEDWAEDWLGDCEAQVVWGYKSEREDNPEYCRAEKVQASNALLTLQSDEFNINNGVLIEYKGKKENVVIPEGVVEIGRDAFMWCGSLVKIEIPAGVTKIGDGAFTFCGALKSVKIPQSVTAIGLHPFYACNSLESIAVETGNKVYSVSGNCLIETKAKKLICGCNNSVIPTDGSVTEIEAFAFGGLDNLNKIIIPDSVIKVGDSVFENYDGDLIVNCAAKTKPDGWDEYWLADCGAKVVWGYRGKEEDKPKVQTASAVSGAEAGLKTFAKALPETVTEQTAIEPLNISNEDFEIEAGVLHTYKGKNKNVVIPNGVTEIESFAFIEHYEIESLSIPSSVIRIASSAFKSSVFSRGEPLLSNRLDISSDIDYTFSCCDSLASIKVASGNKVYHSSGNCLIHTETKRLILGCKNSVIPNDGSVTVIEEGAFFRCFSLCKISIPNSVKVIGDGAFGYCDSLRSIVMPKSVTYIYFNAFKHCSKLKNVEIRGRLTYIGEEAFSGCASLEQINIPDSVESIGHYAFFGCGLDSVIVPEGVRSVGEHAFDCYLSENFKIYCRAKKQPAGWHKDWNKGAKTVISTIKSKLFDNEDAKFSGRYKTVWNYKGN